jgi:hypothetical protein
MKSGVNQKVIGFLSFRTDKLFGFDAKSDDLAFATPRSWEMVSNILNTVSDDVNAVYPMIAGLVGQGIAPLDAAACAAWLHGAAGDLCEESLGQYAMLPTDMLQVLPRLLK